MTNQLESKLTEILTSTQGVGTDIYEVVKAQAPELAREVVVNAVVTNSTYIVISAVGSMACFALALFSWRKFSKTKDYDDSCGWMMLGLVASIVFIPCVFKTISSAGNLARCYYAPRVVFIQEAARIVKGK